MSEPVAATPFADRLAAAVTERRSQLVVGFDPRLEPPPLEPRVRQCSAVPKPRMRSRFCRGLIDAVCPYVVAVKPQAACFEVLGADGMRALEEVCEYAATAGPPRRRRREARRHRPHGARIRGRLPRAAKRFRPLATPSPSARISAGIRSSRSSPVPALRRWCLLPREDVESRRHRRPGSHPVGRNQGLATRREARRRAGPGRAGECGLSSVGAVVGATYPRAVSEARKLDAAIRSPAPGIGAQGATPADVARAFTSGPASALVTVSRSVIYAYRFEGTTGGRRVRRGRPPPGEVWAASGW